MRFVLCILLLSFFVSSVFTQCLVDNTFRQLNLVGCTQPTDPSPRGQYDECTIPPSSFAASPASNWVSTGDVRLTNWQQAGPDYLPELYGTSNLASWFDFTTVGDRTSCVISFGIAGHGGNIPFNLRAVDSGGTTLVNSNQVATQSSCTFSSCDLTIIAIPISSVPRDNVTFTWSVAGLGAGQSFVLRGPCLAACAPSPTPSPTISTTPSRSQTPTASMTPSISSSPSPCVRINIVGHEIDGGQVIQNDFKESVTGWINHTNCIARAGMAFVTETEHCMNGNHAPLAFGPVVGGPAYIEGNMVAGIPDIAIGLYSCRVPPGPQITCDGTPPESTLVYTRLASYANWIGETMRKCHDWDKSLQIEKEHRVKRIVKDFERREKAREQKIQDLGGKSVVVPEDHPDEPNPPNWENDGSFRPAVWHNLDPHYHDFSGNPWGNDGKWDHDNNGGGNWNGGGKW